MRLRRFLHRLWEHRRRLLRFAVGAVALFVVALLLLLSWPMDTEHYLYSESSPTLLDREGLPLYCSLNSREQWSFPITLHGVSPHLIAATIAAEDQRFYSHHGVDLLAFARAFRQNLRRGGVRSGASTISMQVVKLADQASGRSSLTQKCWQIIQAIRLELRVDKDRILAAYLNRAPYFRNVRGCEAASRRLFGKPCRELTLAQASLLAGLPKAPSVLDPLSHPAAARRRRAYVLMRLEQEGHIASSRREEIDSADLDASSHSFPGFAPHLALAHLGQKRGKGPVNTTLNRHMQKQTEGIVGDEVERLFRASGGEIQNCAALILDAPSASVLAWVGSSDFLDSSRQGQFNAALAIRPPGSTLKPFLYAYAMQEDQLYPDEILLDAPMDRGLYNPRNFDEQYGGHVAAKDALRESLNIPALCLLSRVGIEAFHAHLQSIGFRNMDQPSDYYGLGLALGNAGAQLSELAAAYAILANDGVYREIRWEENAGDQPVRRIFSADIARQVSDMLSQALITDRSEIEVTERAIPTVSWKTGTSSGRHDAWAVLYDSHYVVAVWVGNNDYSPSTQLVGSEAALPVATRLYKILPQPDTPPHRRQIDFKTIPMCSASGLPANAECPAVRESTIPSSLHTLRRCDVHHKRPANDKSIAGPVEYWPAGPLGWDLAATPRDVKTVKAQTTKLNIIQPSDDARFIRTRARNGDRVQLASSLDDYHTIHWYLDGQFLGSSEPDKPLHLDLKPGEHRLSALTPKGESDQVTFEVVDPSGLQ